MSDYPMETQPSMPRKGKVEHKFGIPSTLDLHKAEPSTIIDKRNFTLMSVKQTAKKAAGVWQEAKTSEEKSASREPK